MAVGARTEAVLVGAPLTVVLSTIAALGLVTPEAVERVPASAYAVAIALVGAIATAANARNARNTRNAVGVDQRTRRIWAGAAASIGLATLATVGTLLGWPDPIVFGGLRGLHLVAIVATILVGSAYRPSSRIWPLLLLDGWIVAASAFLLVWVLLGLTGSPRPELPGASPVLFWVPADLLIAAAAVGVAMRSGRSAGSASALAAVAAVVTVAADTALGLATGPQFGALLWLVVLTALAATAVLGPVDAWEADLPPALYPPTLRLPQWLVVPGLLAAVLPGADAVVVVAAVSVVLALAAELAVSGRQNLALWLQVSRQADRLDQLLSESRDVIVQIDDRGVVQFANDALEHVLGFPPEGFVGRHGLALVHPDDRVTLVRDIQRVGDGGLAGARVNARFQHADGGWRTVEATVTPRSGDATGFTLSARDVSERVTLEEELRRLAGTDALTGLLNRPAFLSLLEERLRDGSATVLFVDLDGFKQVNDMDGHAAGDRLLREVAETLRRELRGRDVAARLGGDEFAVLVGGDSPGEAQAVAERLVHRLRRMPSDPARRTAASIGVASGRMVSAETLLGDADLAMYEAKARGGRRYVGFEQWMRERVTERARIGAALEQACRGEGLLIDVQPIVAMERGRWVGFEALARWQDGEHRREPAEFLPIAEEAGLIDPLGRWVLYRSLAWLSRWPDRGAGISVNVAGVQLATVGFADWVHQQLAGHGVAPHRLTLEISERTALGDLQRATAVLQPLRAIGVRIALDDFGTGFSSLGHLADLPVDELKIDRRFVAGLGRRQQDEALVRAVCGLAEDLGLRVVAEGVETAAQEYSLLEHGCRLGQGFRFARPTPLSELPVPAASAPGARAKGRPTGRRPGIVASG